MICLTVDILLASLSECNDVSECPNKGENYVCIFNKCSCDSGFELDGQDCVGMLPNWCFYITSECINLKVFLGFSTTLLAFIGH